MNLKNETGIGFSGSGIRGLVSELSDKVVYAYTRAFIEYLEKIDNVVNKEIAIAGDRRESTPDLMKVVALAIIDKGYKVINCGIIPSPALAFFGIKKEIPSIMITGSHIPGDRNGIKFNNVDGEILKDDERGIEEMEVLIEESVNLKVPSLPEVDGEAEEIFIKRYLNFFPAGILAGKKIGLYGHSAVGREMLFTILNRLGAEVVKIEYLDNFVAIDTEAVDDKLKENGIKWQAEYGVEALVSTDGDSDRPLIANEYGNWLRGDVLGIITAKYLGAKAVVTAISCNTALEKSGWFEIVEKVKINSPYIVAKLDELTKSGKEGVVGYGSDGGFLVATDIEKEGKVLDRLPTRDAIIVILSCLASTFYENKTISELINHLPARFTASGSLKGFPTEKALRIIEGLSVEKINIMFEGKLKVADINDIDGKRITFTTGEIIHFRPSKNAPEFRNYTEADSQERAEELSQIAGQIIANWAKS